jgi:SAM-dependent methyltransferase
VTEPTPRSAVADQASAANGTRHAVSGDGSGRPVVDGWREAEPLVVGVDLDRHAQESSNFRKHTSGNPLQRRLIARFHRAIVERVAALAPERALDAGCGEGFVAHLLLDRIDGLRLTGCELSDAALRLARTANPEADFARGSITALPFADRSFDVVCCFEVLEHLPDDGPAQALAEFARVARRGVVLSVPHEPVFSLANVARGKNLSVRPRGSDPDHRHFWSHGAFARLVSEHFASVTVTGSFPWIICVGEGPIVRSRR